MDKAQREARQKQRMEDLRQKTTQSPDESGSWFERMARAPVETVPDSDTRRRWNEAAAARADEEAEARERREAEQAALQRLQEEAKAPAPTKQVSLDGLENMKFRLERLQNERNAIDEEEGKDRAALAVQRQEEQVAATAAVVAGKDMDFSETTKAEMRFAARQETRNQRRAALDRTEPTIRDGIVTALAKEIRQLRGWVRRRTEEIVLEQATLVRRLIALHAEEVEMQRRALGEIGRVRKVLPAIELPPATREEGGEFKQVTDERGNVLSTTVVTRPRTITQLDTPDLKTVRSFLEDHFIGAPALSTSRRASLLGQLNEILIAMKNEGFNV